jgi:hypothetical protein
VTARHHHRRAEARPTREGKQTEEGLATLNTVLAGGGGVRLRFLYREALLYFAAAEASLQRAATSPPPPVCFV